MMSGKRGAKSSFLTSTADMLNSSSFYDHFDDGKGLESNLSRYEEREVKLVAKNGRRVTAVIDQYGGMAVQEMKDLREA